MNNAMCRGTTPAILAMLDQRARDKLRCVIRLRHPMVDISGTKPERRALAPLS